MIPKSQCPVCSSDPTLYHQRTERETIRIVTLWCGAGHMWEVRWSVAV